MLFDLYGLADLIFCGGSLVPMGGQNILEPAAWGKAVFYGPHMDNFLEACQLLETAGCGKRPSCIEQSESDSNQTSATTQRGA
jgi:3-deoxy-D-manno-octulosonic-acid transferase